VVQQYLNSSRSYRKEDGVGLSGLSNGYAYGMLMSKETASVLEQLELLRAVRKIYPESSLLVYNITHQAKMYAINNVEGPVYYQGRNGCKYTNGHSQVGVMPPESDKTVTIDFSPIQVSITKGTLLEDCKKKLGEVLGKDLFSREFPTVRKAPYYTHFQEYHLIPSKHYHNMLVYYTNIKRGKREVEAKQPAQQGKKKKNNNPPPLVKKEVVYDPHLVEPKALLRRMYLANYVRNNWFHCAYHFGAFVSHFEELGAYSMNHVLHPPFQEAKAVADALTFSAIQVDTVVLNGIQAAATAKTKPKKEFKSLSIKLPDGDAALEKVKKVVKLDRKDDPKKVVKKVEIALPEKKYLGKGKEKEESVEEEEEEVDLEKDSGDEDAEDDVSEQTEPNVLTLIPRSGTFI